MSSKGRAFETRLYNEWRIDQDYWDKLSPSEQEYLLNFLKDFYDRADHNAAQRDILTITDEQAACLLYPRQRSHYTPDDYKEDPCPRSAPTRRTRRSE